MIARRNDIPKAFLRNGISVPLGNKVGSGGTGVIYAAPNNMAAKVSRRKPKPKTVEKWEATRRLPLQTDSPKESVFVQPKKLLFGTKDEPIGFLTPLVPEGVELRFMADREFRQELLPHVPWGGQLRVAIAVARLTKRLHKAGIVDGDLKPAQFLVSKNPAKRLRVYRVDLDGMSFTIAGQKYISQAHTPMYCEPHPEPLDSRTQLYDRYSLAVTLYELLVNQRPYFGAGTPTEQIQKNSWVGTLSDHELCQTSLYRSRRLLPPRLFTLFEQAFDLGFNHREARPSSGRWERALRATLKNLTRCPIGHVISKEMPTCFFCDEEQRLGEPFYASESLGKPCPKPKVPKPQPTPQTQSAFHFQANQHTPPRFWKAIQIKAQKYLAPLFKTIMEKFKKMKQRG